MQTVINDQNIPVILKKSLRAKRINFKIRQGRVILTVPRLANVKRAFDFLNSYKDIVNARLAKQHKVSYAHDAHITILGQQYSINYTNKLRGGIVIIDNKIIINGYHKTAEKRLKLFLANFLKQKATELAVKFCVRLSLNFNNIIVRSMVERWASCTSGGTLLFSTKLLFTPVHVFEYVVAHEVCHLQELNHSSRFWTLVETIYPNWKEARQWLKEEGKYIL